MTGPSATDLYRTAQILMREGQPVFPCRATGEKAKAPLTKNGLHDASLDLATVKGWWRNHRDAAIGIPTGIVWDVLDVDIKEGADGRKHMSRLQSLGLLNGCQRIVKTPSGGFHLYFKAAPGLTNTANAALGLDVRATGGYVLAAGSYIETPDYAGYYTDMGPVEDHTDDPLLWNLIASSLLPVDQTTRKPIVLLEYERQSSLASLRGWLSERQSGERNNALHWAVCRCIENGLDPYELTEVAYLIGLTEDETNLTISSALRRAGVTADELDSEAEAMFPDID